jgi:hypothetical protein
MIQDYSEGQVQQVPMLYIPKILKLLDSCVYRKLIRVDAVMESPKLAE